MHARSRYEDARWRGSRPITVRRGLVTLIS